MRELIWKHQNGTITSGGSSGGSNSGSSSGSSSSGGSSSNSSSRSISGGSGSAATGSVIGSGGGASDALHIRYAGRDYETIKAVYKEPKSHNGFEGDPPHPVFVYIHPPLRPSHIFTRPYDAINIYA